MALQGDFREHVRALEEAGARTRLVRLPEDLEGLDGLVIPGGESTTMTMLMDRMGLAGAVRRALADGLPALATCAGMIVLADRITDGLPDQRGLQTLDITVRRNGYGSQLDSFEAELDVSGLEGGRFPAVFIRAPVVEEAGSAEVMATYEGKPVALRQGSVMALAFHPELSGDLRLHREFLKMVASAPHPPPSAGRGEDRKDLPSPAGRGEDKRASWGR
jgi:5'-phosphate synthase pdxT subunit